VPISQITVVRDLRPMGMEPADLTGIACIASREEMDLSDWLGPAPHLPTKLRVPGRFVFAISRRDECRQNQGRD
jgi:hypothetical protein